MEQDTVRRAFVVIPVFLHWLAASEISVIVKSERLTQRPKMGNPNATNCKVWLKKVWSSKIHFLAKTTQYLLK